MKPKPTKTTNNKPYGWIHRIIVILIFLLIVIGIIICSHSCSVMYFNRQVDTAVTTVRMDTIRDTISEKHLGIKLDWNDNDHKKK